MAIATSAVLSPCMSLILLVLSLQADSRFPLPAKLPPKQGRPPMVGPDIWSFASPTSSVR